MQRIFTKTARTYDENGNLASKRCGKCNEIKPADQFYVKKKSKQCIDGYNYQCIICHKLAWHKQAEDPEARKRWLLQRIKSKCKIEGLEFNLTIDDLHVPDVCPVLGIPLKFGVKGNKLQETKGGRIPHDSPSVDRIDPTKGYVKGNVIMVSYRANFLKSDASMDELQSIVTFYNAKKACA